MKKDLSYNEIEDIDILRTHSSLEDINLAHNKVL